MFLLNIHWVLMRVRSLMNGNTSSAVMSVTTRLPRNGAGGTFGAAGRLAERRGFATACVGQQTGPARSGLPLRGAGFVSGRWFSVRPIIPRLPVAFNRFSAINLSMMRRPANASSP